jgi:hypothetical protein
MAGNDRYPAVAAMTGLIARFKRALHHRRLSASTGAISGLIGALSIIVGAVAAHFAPRGWRRLAFALHLAKKPLIFKLAPYIAGAAAAATAAALIKFVSWCLESEDEPRAALPPGGHAAHSDRSATTDQRFGPDEFH